MGSVATASLPAVLSNVQVVPGASSVARIGDVLLWFETGPDRGGPMVTQLLQEVQGVASGSVPSQAMGARLAAVLNSGDAQAVPALAAGTPEDGGLRVVVHGSGALVADGVHVPNGWADQVVTDRRSFFLGRNRVTPMVPTSSPTLNLEDGVVPGDGVSFSLATVPEPSPERGGGPGAPGLPQGSSPIAWPPPRPAPERPAGERVSVPPRPPTTAPGGSPAGRLVLDDGSSAVLARTCVLGTTPDASPAVKTGAAVPLTVLGTGVAGVHAELRVDQAEVAVRDLGAALTHVLPPGALTWIALAPGQVTPIAPGTRIAVGQRTFSYERP